MKQTKTTCDFCGEKEKEVYCLYKFIYQTDKSMYDIGLVKLRDMMDEWILQKLYHLSPTEMLLLRPDLVNEFLKWYNPKEDLITWYFSNYKMCPTCYEEYKNNIPER